VHNLLNLVKELEEPVIVEKDDIFFGQIVLVNDVIISTLKNKLQLFQWLH
jgi:nitrogen fixation protein